MAFSARRIFAAGAAHLDRIARATGHIEPLSVSAGTITALLAGPAVQAALAVRHCGAEVGMMTGRGGDADGETLAAALAAAGIDDLALTWLDRPSPGFTSVLDGQGHLVAGIADMRLYELLSGRVFSRVHIRAAMAACDALILDANLPPSGIAYLVERFCDRPIAAIGVTPAKAPRLRPHLGALSLLFVSRAEALLLVDATSEIGSTELAGRLAEAGVRHAVITNGAATATILDKGVVSLQDLSAAAEPSGARHRLAGTTTLAFSEGWPFIEAVHFAIATAYGGAEETATAPLSAETTVSSQ